MCTPEKIRGSIGSIFSRTDDVEKVTAMAVNRCLELCDYNFTTFTTSTEPLNVKELFRQTEGIEDNG